MPREVDVGWRPVQRRLQGATAEMFEGGVFAWVGEPLHTDDKFYTNVFSFERGKVEVLSGDNDFGLQACQARFRWGPLAILEYDERSKRFACVGHMREPIHLLECDLTDFVEAHALQSSS